MEQTTSKGTNFRRFRKEDNEDCKEETYTGAAVTVPFRWEESPGRAKPVEPKPNLQIDKLLSKDESFGKSSIGSIYKPTQRGQVPFIWEEEPGKPKTPTNQNTCSLPSLSPPPNFRSPSGFMSPRKPYSRRAKLVDTMKKKLNSLNHFSAKDVGQSRRSAPTSSRYNMVFESFSDPGGSEGYDYIEDLSGNGSYISMESLESAFKFSSASSCSSESVNISVVSKESVFPRNNRCFPTCVRFPAPREYFLCRKMPLSAAMCVKERKCSVVGDCSEDKEDGGVREIVLELGPPIPTEVQMRAFGAPKRSIFPPTKVLGVQRILHACLPLRMPPCRSQVPGQTAV